MKRSLTVLASALLPLTVVAAGIFPDVSDTHPFKAHIESLAKAGIVKGNADGKYYPDRDVNRAEYLTLLYRATNRPPRPIFTGCFKDVPRGAWFELVVCDAASKETGFVQGYSDGNFKPANSVTRVEALKMTLTVFGLAVADVTASDKDIIKFADLSVSAWYTGYISASYKHSLLPISSIGGSRFYPDKPLTRGEAAAIIFNAQAARSKQNETMPTASSSSSKPAPDPAVIKDVTFPFADTSEFQGRKSVSYAFEIKEKTVISINALANGNTNSDISCRLYLFNESGFSYEYYLGMQETNRCRMLVSVRPGSYHLQLQPTTPGVPYFVEAKVGTATDGNDGFQEAKTLIAASPIVGTLESGDLFDWYLITVTTPRPGTVFVTSEERLECTIYPGIDVDLFGFSEPQCGVEYLFQPGAYTVGVGRKGGMDTATQVNYTIFWR